MILGCGVDLTDVARFEQEVARRGGGLTEALFGAGELEWCRRRRRPCEGYAMAYAAKEALFKALGTGMVGRMTWSDIAIAWPAGAARPAMTLSGETAALAAAMGADGVHVAVAATREHAVAWVVVSGLGTRDSFVTLKQVHSATQRHGPSPESGTPGPDTGPSAHFR